VKKKAAKKTAKKTAKKVALGFRTPATRPPKVGGRERSTDMREMWARVGRRPLEESAALAELASEVKRLREAKGLSIAQLAKKIEAAPATLIKFEERGSGIPLKVLLIICAEVGAVLKVVSDEGSSKKK